MPLITAPVLVGLPLMIAMAPLSLVMIVPWQSMMFVVDEGVAASKKACRLLRLASMAGFLPRVLKRPEVDRCSIDEQKMNPVADETNRRKSRSHFSHTGVVFIGAFFSSEIRFIAPFSHLLENILFFVAEAEHFLSGCMSCLIVSV